MKDKDLVEIEYVGRIKETGDIFDLTNEKLAKENNIFNPKARYGPVNLIIGAGHVLEGLEKKIKDMNIGEKKKIELPPENAFGTRDVRLLKTFGLNQFKKQGIAPVPGQFLNMGNMKAKVLSVNGGRVRIDFNHPLAGKTLEYDIKINKKITGTENQIKAIISIHSEIDTKKIRITLQNENVKIILPQVNMLNQEMKKRLADDVAKYVNGVKSVEFSETFGEKINRK